MPVSARTRELLLSGSLPFPTTFPDLGTIRTTQQDNLEVLTIEETYEDWSVKRTVLLDEVSIVFIPNSPTQWYKDVAGRDQGKWKADGQWYSSAEIRGNTGLVDNMQGMVFVGERLRLLNEPVFGATASESFEFSPPIGGRRPLSVCCDPGGRGKP